MKYETRTLKIAVVPEGDSISSDSVTNIEIQDEGAGEFLAVSQNLNALPNENKNRMICVDPKDWPHLKAGIEKMISQCREGQ
jgi:hypothetical protein